MKFLFRFLGAASLFFAAEVLLAQDSFPSSLSTATPTPSPPPQLVPTPLPPPTGQPVIPSAANIPDLSQLDALFKQSSMGKQADEFKYHLEMRKLANQVTGNPAIEAARAAAAAARTDLEKRGKLRAYYNLYYGGMISLAATPDLKAYVEKERTDHLALLSQSRVRPTPESSKSPER